MTNLFDDHRYQVEQSLLPKELYTVGPALMSRLLKYVDSVMEYLYAKTGEEISGVAFEESHRIYTRDEFSTLVIHIGMPAPTAPVLSRATYLCYCEKNGEALYFTSELSKESLINAQNTPPTLSSFNFLNFSR